MKVYKYDNIEDLNSQLSLLKKNRVRIFAVKIFSSYVGKDKDRLEERFYIIAQGDIE